MKKTLLLSALVLSLVSTGAIAQTTTTTTAATPVVAATPAIPAVTLLTVLNTLDSQSFTVLQLESKKNGFEAKVVTAEGFMQEINLDQAGNILPSEHKSPTVSMIAALELLEKAGYTSISEIKVHHHMFYEVEALDPKNNKKVEVKVNALTGEIDADHEWF